VPAKITKQQSLAADEAVKGNLAVGERVQGSQVELKTQQASMSSIFVPYKLF
jgi:hypothetical protein